MNANLPISNHKDEILRAIKENDVVVITAETGAGKSTQVPQFLAEAGHNVVVTQPRRLAARTVADRVSEELFYRLSQSEVVDSTRDKLKNLVGYRTAYERSDHRDNKILFCTDGLQMVRELIGNTNTDVLIIDEVHEWNINIETLVAWTRKQISEGRKMKLVLMSATMEAEKLAKYYGEDTPVISVPGRLYPVSEDQVSPNQLVSSIEKLVAKGRNVLVFQPGKKEIEQTIEALNKTDINAEILPLHGNLTPQEQKLCFKNYDKPKVVVSTNVAQTSVTIPDIDAVIDSGMEKRIELSDGIEGLYLKPISNADIKQRKGRAGRCKDGEYILASDIDIKDRPDFPRAEIERKRLDQLVLRLASIGFDATELQFFHQPEEKILEEAKRALHALGAMTEDGKVTKIGKLMSKFPLSVQYSRMLIEAEKYGVTNDVLTAVSILEVGGLRAKGDVWKEYTNETESDILAELDLWKSAQGKRNSELREMGIFTKSYWRAKELRRKLQGELRRNNLQQSSTGNRQSILKACVAGMVDHLYKNNYGDYKNGDGSIRQLGRESVIKNSSEWLVGLPKDIQFKDRRGYLRTLNLVTMATKVDPKWLMDIAPQLVKKRQERYSWNYDSNEVIADELIIFNSNEIERKSVSAKPATEAYKIFGQIIANKLNGLPKSVINAVEDNKLLQEISKDLYLRSVGEAIDIKHNIFEEHYAKILSEHKILSLQALTDAITSGKLKAESFIIKLDNFISEEDQIRIKTENPTQFLIEGISFHVGYLEDYYNFKAILTMDVNQLTSLMANNSELRLPSGRIITICLSDKDYEEFSANSIEDLQLKVKSHQKKLARDADEKTNFDKYMSEAKTLQRTVFDTINLIDENGLYRDYGFNDLYDFNYSVKYPALEAIDNINHHPLDAKELLEEVKNKLELAQRAKKDAESKQEETDKLVESGEILIDFGGYFRFMGRTGQSQYWVIQTDGIEREADQISYRKRYKSEGEKIWHKVNRDELAISWKKSNTASEHEFYIDKLPTKGCTKDQLKTIKSLQQKISDLWENALSMSGKPSPGIANGWNLFDDSEAYEDKLMTDADLKPADSEEINSAIIDLMSKFGKVPSKNEIKKTTAQPVSDSRQIQSTKITSDNRVTPVFRLLAEMTEDEIYEEYDNNETQIIEILDANSDLDSIFNNLKIAQSKLITLEIKLEKAINRRDRFENESQNLKKKAVKQQNEKINTTITKLRENRKIIKNDIKKLEQISRAMKHDKKRIDELRTRQTQIEEAM